MEPIKYILEAIYSERDLYGNCYWALRFTDCATGKTVQGTVTGGESNIYAICNEWHGGNWEPRDIKFSCHSLKKREFKQLTKAWDYAGCSPVDLTEWIRARLADG